MTVTGYVNGKVVDKALPLEVIRRRLQLEALPGAVVRRGTAMSFRMFPDTAGGAAWSGITWRISDSTAVSGSTCGAGKTACTEIALNNYRRTAIAVVDDSLQEQGQNIRVFRKFEIIPDNASPKLGDTVVFTAFLDGEKHPIARWAWDRSGRPSCANSATCEQVMDTVGAVAIVGWIFPAGEDSAVAAVSPIPPALRVTAQPETVNRGALVALSFTKEGAAELAESWRFIPDSSGGDTVACPSNSSGCEKVMRVGGTMRALWRMYRHLDSAEAYIAVGDGCSATPLSRPVGRGLAMASVTTCVPPEPALVFSASCVMEGTGIRGSSVICSATVQPPTPFTISTRTAERTVARDFASAKPYPLEEEVAAISEPVNDQLPAGEKHVWAGVAVAKTTVTFIARAQVGGRDTAMVAHASFEPLPRTWARLRFDETRGVVRGDTLGFPPPSGERGSFATLPAIGVIMGIFNPRIPMVTEADLAAVDSGPNKNLAFAPREITLSGYDILVHPALLQPLTLPASVARDSIADWQARQLGVYNQASTDSTGVSYCTASLLWDYRAFVERHEGATKAQNSHWGIADSVFVSAGVHRYVEAFSTEGQPVDARIDMANLIRNVLAVKGPVVDANAWFDSEASGEYAALARICTFVR